MVTPNSVDAEKAASDRYSGDIPMWASRSSNPIDWFRMRGSSTAVSTPTHRITVASRGVQNSKRSSSFTGGQGKTMPNQVPRYITWSRAIVDSKLFTTFTMLLTVYALCGGDIRLLTTEEPADIFFDGITIGCLVIFSVEIVLCTLGKDDYFLSFFMVLDVISTVTLVLDLTIISNLILGDEEELKNIRGSRTAKIGARATRLVRVIRLVRIIKLYKAIYEANQAKKRKARRAQNPGDDDDDWDDDEVSARRDQLNRESRVGKKLSELTIRRVIILVLTMLLLHKLLRIDQSQQFKTSADFGADVVNQALDKLRLNPNNETTRLKYERAMLNYIYYHNWYTGHAGACPGDKLCSSMYDSHLFWVGVVSNNLDTLREKAELARIRRSTVDAWVQSVAKVESSDASMWVFAFGRFPLEVEAKLGQPWVDECPTASGGYHRTGVSLIDKEREDWGVNYAARCPENLRRGERRKYAPALLVSESRYESWHLAFYFDTRPFVFWEAIFSLCVVCYICLALCIASLMFSNDANRLVLYPVENMIAKVEAIRDNPLSAMKVADDEFKVEEIKKSKAKKEAASRTWSKALKDALLCNSKDNVPELMETVVLEKTIIKLGSLLALGFGQAGAQIIEHNMNGIDSACVDAMIDGARVDCIVGATRIRDFSTATEVLQSKVMTFVNQIAEIVHGVVDEFHGYASKNNGEFFLMIWRKSADMEPEKAAKLADMSIVAFARILGAVHRSPVLAAYRGHPGLQQRLGKNCRVNLSSGLHFGWAIEGAVGSEFKIDASYLSPNVSIAESVERATQIYGVNILVAESVICICSKAVSAKCRLIDRVKITGCVTPMELYAIDLDYMSLTVEPLPAMQINWTSRQRFRVRQFLETEKTSKWTTEVVNSFNDNPEIACMRFRYTVEFLHVFNMGYQNYSQGEWQVAQRLLSRTRTMLGIVDGPSLALLRYMDAHHRRTPESREYKAPKDWHGVRELGLAYLQ